MDDQQPSFAEWMAQEAAERAAPKVWAWLIGGGMAVLTPVLVTVAAVIAGLALLAGVGHWAANFFGPHPPQIATSASRPTEWLITANQYANQYQVPNVVIMAILAESSGGQVYGDRYYCSNGQSTGAVCSAVFHPGVLGIGSHGVHTVGVSVGLMGLSTQRGLPGVSLTGSQSPQANIALGVQRLAYDWHRAPAPQALRAFHDTIQIPPHGWTPTGAFASGVATWVARYEVAPTLGAWPLASWSHKTGQFTDPGNTPEWVFVVGAAPVGATSAITLAPPSPSHTVTGTKTVCQTVTHAVTTTTPGPTRTLRQRLPNGGFVTRTVQAPPVVTVTHTTARVCKTVTTHQVVPGQSHLLHVKALMEPVQVWGTTAKGQHIPFTLSTFNKQIPVWSGGSVWGAKVALTGPNALTLISAEWSNGVMDTINWPETPTGVTGSAHVVSDSQALQQWWPDILAASHQTGVPAPWIASEMLNESRGDQFAAQNGLAGAYGLMQLEPGTDGATNADRQNPRLNLLYGARYLASLHQATGSWRLASASYYGGLGSVEHAGWHPGMTWSQAQPGLNRYVPFPSAGNSLTLGAYAANIQATAQWVQHHMP